MALNPSVVDSIESAINAMWSNGVIPSIQRLEVTTGLDAETIREATKELERQGRIKSLPLDQPETSMRK